MGSEMCIRDRLLEGYGVSVLAGEAFGPSAAGHIRIGLVVDQVKLAEACRRIALYAAQLLRVRRACDSKPPSN